MPTIRKLMFGITPFNYLASRLAQDTDFLEDARYILKLDEDAYLRLATQLAKTDSFLSRSNLNTLVSEVLHEDSDRIASFIYRIGDIVHGADMDVVDAMDALSTAIEEKAEGLEPQERRTLGERIRKLVAEPIGIAKQFKALQLVGAIGAKLDDFRIICDIRPIFDRQRERIDGAIPLTILRLEYTQPDGESAVVELRVTEKQIAELRERIADADVKLKMIKELLTSYHLAIPKTKSTISEDKP